MYFEKAKEKLEAEAKNGKFGTKAAATATAAAAGLASNSST